MSSLSSKSLKSKDDLINEHTPLVASVILRRFPNYRDREDLMQEGLLALSKAIDTYQPDQGSFSNWVTVCVTRRSLNYILRKTDIVKGQEVVPISFLEERAAPQAFDLEMVDIVSNYDSNLCKKLLTGERKTKKEAKKIKKLRELLSKKYPEYSGKNQ